MVCITDRFYAQIGITLTGEIVFYTGLHWGTPPDNLIWRWTEEDHPLDPEEIVFGDGIYASKFLLLAVSCVLIVMYV